MIRLFTVIYIILVAVFLLYVQNISTTYTYFANLGDPGASLVSFRGSFVDVTIRLTIIAHVVIPGVVLFALNETNPYAIYVFVVFMLMTLLGIVGMGTAYGSCNTYFGNICNDLQYCCNFPGNGCPTSIPCPSIINLGPNETFLGLFWINFVLFLLQLAYLFYTQIWLKLPSKIKEKIDKEEKEEVQEEEKKEPLNEQIKVIQPVGKKVLHGLKRKIKI